MLGQDSSQDPDEQEFIMAMLKSWEEGKAEARTETRADAVLTVLRVRGIAVPDATRRRIVAEKDLAQDQRDQLRRMRQLVVPSVLVCEQRRLDAADRAVVAALWRAQGAVVRRKRATRLRRDQRA